MYKKLFFVGSRLVLGVTTLLAIVLQAMHVVNAGVFNPFNYLGYFTNLSNLFAAIIFIISALYLLLSRKPSARDDIIRGAATLYMAVTGVIYVTLLANEDLGLLMPWVNILTHIVMPAAVIADWLYQPPRTRLAMQQTLLWLIFPALYLLYTLIRGSIIGWYPYPFLNPSLVGGYGGVALYSIGILAVFFALGWGLMKIGGLMKRHIA